MIEKLEALKRKAKEDYENKRKKLEIEYKKNIDAIERVFALMDRGTSTNEPTIIHHKTSELPLHEQENMADSRTVNKRIDSFISNYDNYLNINPSSSQVQKYLIELFSIL